jgi:diguanylate cyclase (GGDEF)-like protein
VSAGALLSEGRWRLARVLLAVNTAIFALFAAQVSSGLGGPVVDDIFSPWVYELLMLLPAVICALRAATVQRERKAWLCASVALTCWLAGDLYYEAFLAGADNPPYPSPADAAWLLFFPCAYATLALLIRARGGRFRWTAWLDGLIGVLSTVAVASTLVFGALIALTDGDAATVTTNLAYPIGDLVLIGFVAVGLTLNHWRGSRALVLLGLGLASTAIADAAYLVGSAHGTWADGGATDAAWPLSALLIAAAAWHLPTDRRRAGEQDGLRANAPTVVFALLSVAVLVRDVFAPVNALAGLAATGAMSVIVVRLVLAGNQQRALERNTVLALTDDLTGLANRRAFYAEAESRIDGALDAGRPVALLLIDLDRFKDLNDTLGHAAGDDLLCQFSARLTRAMPASALLSRLGGDEFVVLLASGSGEDAARSAARRLTDELEQPFHLDGLRTKVRASVGAAIAPQHGSDRALLLRHADVAMYEAKTRQTEIEVYKPGEDRHSRERIELAGQLPDAIDHEQLVLHFQPKVELSSGRVAGVEALVRWRHPERGMLGPNEFLPLAEQHGLMRRLTLEVLRQALDQQAEWRRGGIDLQTAVNISAANLLDPRFPGDVTELVRRHEVPEGSLVLELTEDTLMADPEGALDVLAQLGELGIGLALDDFGTGYSSLAHLKRLPVQELKIDRSFVLDMVADAEDAVIVRSTVDLGRNLGLRVVAEGVETAAAYEQLAGYGCHAAQGYHLSRPLPARELAAWLRRRGMAPALAN